MPFCNNLPDHRQRIPYSHGRKSEEKNFNLRLRIFICQSNTLHKPLMGWPNHSITVIFAILCDTATFINESFKTSFSTRWIAFASSFWLQEWGPPLSQTNSIYFHLCKVNGSLNGFIACTYVYFSSAGMVIVTAAVLVERYFSSLFFSLGRHLLGANVLSFAKSSAVPGVFVVFISDIITVRWFAGFSFAFLFCSWPYPRVPPSSEENTDIADFYGGSFDRC